MTDGSGLALDEVVTYFITFTCYGCHLHGDDAGSVDRKHSLVGSRVLEPNSKRTSSARRLMQQQPYYLDRNRRAIVLTALQQICSLHGWRLLAAHAVDAAQKYTMAVEPRADIGRDSVRR